MDAQDIAEKRLCVRCIDEEFLAKLVIAEGDEGACDYCGQTDRTETIGELADRFERLFEEHYERASGPYTSYEDQRGDSVAYLVEDAGRLPEAAASDIQVVMADRHADFEAAQMGETTEYDVGLTYEESRVNDRELQAEWTALETEVRSRHRFFGSQATATFDRLFGALGELVTRDGRSVIRTIGPGTEVEALFRARVFQSDDPFREAMADPEQFVGTPAPRFARAGRMNPQGVPFFYGATSEALALTEVRPPVGSRAIIARFSLLEPLQILDVEALENVLERGSLFDPDFSCRLERAKFFERLAHRIRMPVMPDDEAKDYLITQVMADYLAVRVTPRLHGLAYGSAQGAKGAFNVALFNEASRVRPAEEPAATRHDVWASTDGDGDVIGYIVSSTLPSRISATPSSDIDFRSLIDLPDDTLLDLRPEVLQLDRQSLKVHHIEGITIATEPHDISRFSHTEGDPEPF